MTNRIEPLATFVDEMDQARVRPRVREGDLMDLGEWDIWIRAAKEVVVRAVGIGCLMVLGAGLWMFIF